MEGFGCAGRGGREQRLARAAAADVGGLMCRGLWVRGAGREGGGSDLSGRRGSVMSGRPALVARAAAAAAVAAARAAAAAALAAVAGSA